MDLIYNLLALVSISYCCWLGLRFAIGLTRQRSDAIDADEIDILLTHEADEDLSEANEAYSADLKAWQDEYTEFEAQQRREAEQKRRVRRFAADVVRALRRDGAR